MERSIEDFSFLLAIGREVLHVTDYSINDLSTQKSFPVVCSSLRNRLL